jgi:RNA polymerase sigma-70 factor (ECF subfamily)
MTSADRLQREELLRRAVLSGDERAWQTWYHETFDRLYAYVLWRLGGQRARADDIVQETYLTAVRHVRRFNPRQGSFLDWLRGLAANIVRHSLRQQQRRLKREQAAGRNVAVEPDSCDCERQEEVAAILGGLPERQEAVLRAKYLDGLSVAEIAAAWNQSPKTIESLLSRARDAFRQSYSKQVPSPSGRGLG